MDQKPDVAVNAWPPPVTSTRCAIAAFAVSSFFFCPTVIFTAVGLTTSPELRVRRAGSLKHRRDSKNHPGAPYLREAPRTPRDMAITVGSQVAVKKSVWRRPAVARSAPAAAGQKVSTFFTSGRNLRRALVPRSSLQTTRGDDESRIRA